MAELTLVEAVNDALHCEFARDENVMVLGEDVGRAGGVFRATAGLLDRFGANRCFDTPLAEAGCSVLPSVSAWPAGGPCARCSTTPSRTRVSTADHPRRPLPLAQRRPHGVPDHDPHALRRRCARTRAARRLARGLLRAHTGHQGCDSLDPADAKGLLAAAIRDPDPVVIFEPKLVYRTARGEVPEGDHVVRSARRALREREPT